jgi:hypothetical protein
MVTLAAIIGGSPGEQRLQRPVHWYRLSLWALAAAFLCQAVLGWFFFGFALLSLVAAVAAPCLAIRGMFSFQSEMKRLGAEAKNVEARRSARALRCNSGPDVLISVMSGLLVLAALMNVQAMNSVMQAFESIFGSEAPPKVATPNLSAMQVAVTLSWMIWLTVAAGLVIAFLRTRKLQQDVQAFQGSGT